MKTFREYINLIESAQQGEPLAEGVMDRLRRIYMDLVYDTPMGTPDSEFLAQWQRMIKDQLGQDIDLDTLAGLQQNFRGRGRTMMGRGDWADYDREMGITEQGVSEGSTTMWEVSFDYGPHMTKTVKVKAGSKQEAKAKVEKAAEKSYTRGIMINWVKPVGQGVAEGSLEEYGNTARGQKMLTKVHKRAVDRVIKADDKNRLEPDYTKRDLKTVRKNQATADRAWDRMSDLDEQGVAEGLSKTPVCKHCGKKQGEHRRGECPKGTKTAVGYTDYGPTRFDPKEPKQQGVREGSASQITRYSGPPEGYTFSRVQQKNYDMLVDILARNGMKFTRIDAETYPGRRSYYDRIGKSTPIMLTSFIGRSPALEWYKYEGQTAGGGTNTVKVGGKKMKLTDFLRLKPEQQDTLLQSGPGQNVAEGSAEKYSYRVTFDDGTHNTVAIPVAKIFQGDNSAKDLITRHFARKGRTVKDIEMMFRPDSVQEGDQELEETQQMEEDPVARITRLHQELNRR